MAKPRIFVSSTYYDLKHLRSSLENFIDSLGYEPILSEKGDIAYAPDTPLDESCYREVRNADVFVIIIGGRYGSEKSEGRTNLPKQFFDRYDSITRQEYMSALEQDIPVYILIEKSVYADFETYLRNKENKTISYAHVDSINIFHLIEEILAQPRNNPIQYFDRYSEIELWLREQWAGLFKELLRRLSSQQQIASLASQVGELAEINKTLKTYLEEVVSKIAPQESSKLIKSETRRLEEANQLAQLEKNGLVEYIMRNCTLPVESIRSTLAESDSHEFFFKKLGEISQNPQLEIRLSNLYNNFPREISRDLGRIRQIIGLSQFPEIAEALPSVSNKQESIKRPQTFKTRKQRTSTKKRGTTLEKATGKKKSDAKK